MAYFVSIRGRYTLVPFPPRGPLHGLEKASRGNNTGEAISGTEDKGSPLYMGGFQSPDAAVLAK